MISKYRRVQVDNPWLSIPALDQLLANEEFLARYRELRNSIFHVQDPGQYAVDVDLGLFNLEPQSAQAMYEGGAEFLSRFFRIPATTPG